MTHYPSRANLALDLTPVSRYHRGNYSWVPACPRKGHMSILKSIGAILAGAIIGIVLSVATDTLMHALHIFPPLGQPMTDSRLLALATIYRTIYGVVGAYVTAWLAPWRPMLHVFILGMLGELASITGAVATWNNTAKYGPHWYPIALVILALPPALFGGWLYKMHTV